MRIFISWSGERGRLVAGILRSWLADALHNAEPWVSSEDIDAGARWSDEVARRLEDTRFGIVCLTPESVSAPWVLFEAGALAKTLDSSHVCPYLVEMSPRDLKQPLAQFGAVEANESGTLKLLRCINRFLEFEGTGKLPDDRLLRCFERWWPDLEQALARIQDSRDWAATSLATTNCGFEQIFRSRSKAITYFTPHLLHEIERSRRGRGLLYITATSMRGFLAADNFNGPQLLEQFVESKCDLRIMLTHPDTAELRAKAEKRPAGAISGEVKQAVTQLQTLGVRSEQMKYYRGAPTVFGISTSEHMLLNPYPYESESNRCMTLVVKKTEDAEDIYHQYFDAHFERPWGHGAPVDEVG
ncbi:MAG: toll/interleukin-1 receptor domain-containing protein [Egibacteraceae bacterium]